MTILRKERKELLKERIKKLENYKHDANRSKELKKIYSSHIKHLKDELRQIEIREGK